MAALAGERLSSSLSNAPGQSERYRTGLADLPLSFEVNRGQAEQGVEFIAHGEGYRLLLSPAEARLVLRREKGPSAGAEPEVLCDTGLATLALKLVGICDAVFKLLAPFPAVAISLLHLPVTGALRAQGKLSLHHRQQEGENGLDDLLAGWDIGTKPRPRSRPTFHVLLQLFEIDCLRHKSPASFASFRLETRFVALAWTIFSERANH
jgi:hypothetical protein